MITIVAFVVVVTTAWIIRELVVVAIVRRQRRKIQHILRKEVTQRYFAEARNELMDLFFQKKINPNSVTFKRFYQLNTAFMRNPDDYSNLANAVCLSFFRSSTQVIDWTEESKTWDEAVKHMVWATVHALDNLVLQYSTFWRFAYKMHKLTQGGNLTPTGYVQTMASRVKHAAEEAKMRRDPAMREIRLTRQKISSLCSA